MARPDTSTDMPKARLTRASIREGLSLYRYLRPYRGLFIGGLIFISLSAFSTMAFPYMLMAMLNNATGAARGPLARFTPSQVALLLMALLTLQILFSFMRVYLFTKVGENAVADLRKDIYRRLIAAPMDFFAQRRVGELSSRISADVTQIQDTITTSLAEILRGFITLIVGIVFIINISAKLTGLMLSVIPLIIVLALLFSRYIRKSSRQTQDRLADSNTVVIETLQGISSVKSFTNEWYERHRYNGAIRSVIDLAVRNGVLRGSFISTMLFSIFGTIVLVVWYAITQDKTPTGSLVGFVIFTAFVGGTLTGFAELYSQLQKTLGATQRVREILAEPVEAISGSDSATAVSHPLLGTVSLQDLRFTYPTRPDTRILDGLSFSAAPGQVIGVVGPSGAGKSTLAALLLRFYDPQEGAILFDGHDARSIPLTELRRQIGLVPQDVLLFGGSIFENIAYGAPGATQEQVEAAAQQAAAHDFITSFPEGYATIVGERGVRLSGGQRQRIAIARAILKSPVILILDEATSALDSESEALVQEALSRLMQGRTSFVIAHRLSTIRQADKIIVLDEGRLRESGTHDELMQLPDGLYRSLSERQFNVGM